MKGLGAWAHWHDSLNLNENGIWMDEGSTSTVWTATRACSSRKRRWSGTSSGTRSATSRSSTDSCATRRWTTAATASADAPTTASKLTTTALRYAPAPSLAARANSTHLPPPPPGLLIHFSIGFGFRMDAIRCTLAHQMCRCTPTTIVRIRPSSRRDSSATVPPRIALRPTVPLPGSAPPTSTAADPPATTPSRTKLIWVGFLGLFPPPPPPPPPPPSTLTPHDIFHFIGNDPIHHRFQSNITQRQIYHPYYSGSVWARLPSRGRRAETRTPAPSVVGHINFLKNEKEKKERKKERKKEMNSNQKYQITPFVNAGWQCWATRLPSIGRLVKARTPAPSVVG